MKRLKQILIVAAILAVIFLAFQYPWSGSVSRTAATQGLPMTEDGLVDYSMILNERLSKNVTVDNNLVVDLVQVFGTEQNLSPAIREQFLKLLGDPELREDGTYVGPFKFAEDNDPEYDAAEFSETYDQLLSQPWTAVEFPGMANWLEDQQSNLDQLVRASTKPNYFHPLCNGDDVGAMGALLPYAQLVREASRSLNLRAMNKIANGNLEAALVDMAAARCLGAKMAQASTLVEHLIGYAAIGITFETEQVLLAKLAEGAELSNAAIEDYRKVIRETSNLPDLSQCMADGEATFMRDCIQRLERGNTECLQMIGGNDGVSGLAVKVLGGWTNWSVAAEKCEAMYERIGNCMAIESDNDRRVAFQQLDTEIEAIERDTKSAKSVVKSMVGANGRGEIAGDILICMLMPAMEQVDNARVRTKSYDVAELGFALELYRRKHGAFPAALDDVAPEFINAVPLDRLTGLALNYRVTEDGYRLWSLGADQKSSQVGGDGNLIEGERWKDENGQFCDDIVLRVGTGN